VRQSIREFEQGSPNYVAGYAHHLDDYDFTLATQALYDLGFSPVENGNSLHALFLRFYTEKQIGKKGNAILHPNSKK
jgi:hypothetical protein